MFPKFGRNTLNNRIRVDYNINLGRFLGFYVWVTPESDYFLSPYPCLLLLVSFFPESANIQKIVSYIFGADLKVRVG
jgi:hypothetical protein